LVNKVKDENAYDFLYIAKSLFILFQKLAIYAKIFKYKEIYEDFRLKFAWLCVI